MQQPAWVPGKIDHINHQHHITGSTLTMAPARAASPALSLSDSDVDISTALVKNNDNDLSDVEKINGDASKKSSKKKKQLSAPPSNAYLDMLGDDGLSGPRGGGGDGNDNQDHEANDGDDEREDEDEEAFIASHQASANRKAANLKGRTVKKGGGFQAMGLSATTLKAITRKGFSVPTPIQRKTIPLLLDDQDVVGMARTGSGKTAAFVIPMIEKLKSHSAKFGARGLVLSPSRELALQTLKVVKELSRGTDLSSVLLVGGDSLEDQFGFMTKNPDIVIATPGRFLHLKVEMNLDLSSIKYVVFDEADRLFEMGFAAQLSEILHGLPLTRQTLLFSATLPKSLVEFAHAGLQEPTLIRLDAESKISPNLQNAFFSVKSSEKEGALLHVLHEVIKMPTGETTKSKQAREEAQSAQQNSNNKKKRKRSNAATTRHNPHETPTEFSTIIFTATKHHVDYLTALLRAAGFAVSYAYGSLDQTARKIEVATFCSGRSHILVVTDVAARGIDIPILANVINYDFPSQPKIFVHRVGRTARAGNKGWSYSLVRDADVPYLLDLQLFLGQPMILGRGPQNGQKISYNDTVVVGALAQDGVAQQVEWVIKLMDENYDVQSQRSVAMKGEKLYMRTRNAASAESAKRAKDVVDSDNWTKLHPLFVLDEETAKVEAVRESMLAKIGGYKPQETIFEVQGKRNGRKDGEDERVDMMKQIRRKFAGKKEKKAEIVAEKKQLEAEVPSNDGNVNNGETGADDASMASDSDLEVTMSAYSKDKPKPESTGPKDTDDDPVKLFQNPEYFMSYTPTNTTLAEDRGYGVHAGSNINFTEASRHATMDLNGDENPSRTFGQPVSTVRWDKRHKKYVSRANDEDGSKGAKLVRGESGVKIAASFRSGRFDAWKKGKRIGRLPRVGETENPGLASSSGVAGGGKKFKHVREKAPKMPDKLRGDYEQQKKKYDAAKKRQQEVRDDLPSANNNSGGGDSKKGHKGKPGGLNTVDDIRKARDLKAKRRDKNARPSKKKAKTG